MNRTETMELELTRSETRLLHNIIREWLDNHTNENEVIYSMAEDVADELYENLGRSHVL